jgi:hypothetical protein
VKGKRRLLEQGMHSTIITVSKGTNDFEKIDTIVKAAEEKYSLEQTEPSPGSAASISEHHRRRTFSESGFPPLNKITNLQTLLDTMTDLQRYENDTMRDLQQYKINTMRDLQSYQNDNINASKPQVGSSKFEFKSNSTGTRH